MWSQEKGIRSELRSLIGSLVDNAGLVFPVPVSQWVKTDSTTVEVSHRDRMNFIEQLVNHLYQLKIHSFISKIQSGYAKELRTKLAFGNCMIQLDFAENYSFVTQNSAQGFHWTNSQATLHPFVIYIGAKNENVITKSYCIISDEKIMSLRQFLRSFTTL
jgi:hypothetical protein